MKAILLNLKTALLGLALTISLIPSFSQACVFYHSKLIVLRKLAASRVIKNQGKNDNTPEGISLVQKEEINFQKQIDTLFDLTPKTANSPKNKKVQFEKTLQALKTYSGFDSDEWLTDSKKADEILLNGELAAKIMILKIGKPHPAYVFTMPANYVKNTEKYAAQSETYFQKGDYANMRKALFRCLFSAHPNTSGQPWIAPETIK
ncbi:MAG TPA: hypothetical protein VK791_00765 [bacterium]|jgi:hypothetical protein|nr:hypothetical protein [bacterium]